MKRKVLSGEWRVASGAEPQPPYLSTRDTRHSL